LQAGADVVMLDNFDAGPMKEVAARLKGRHPHVLIEGSGGLTEGNIAEFFSPGERNFIFYFPFSWKIGGGGVAVF
jgi:nicotinate-nucleotide pyrophosphorylase (carboxylating)